MSLRERIDRVVEAYRAEHDIPGAAIAVVHDGQITHEDGYGAANLETGAPPTPHTLWPIASLTKSFTGVAAMQLVEQGRLLLDEPIQSYLPAFRFADPEASRKITTRNLLLHAGGIGRSGHQDTLREISDAYDVSVRSLQRYIASGELAAVRFGKAYVVTVDSLRKFLNRPGAVRDGSG